MKDWVKAALVNYGLGLQSVIIINGKKPIWVTRNKVLASKEKEGLGVSSFYALINRALLFKWGTDMMDFISQKDGQNGVDILFWEDKWRGDNTFQSNFPIIYALETQKNISVPLKLSHDDLLCSFRRAPRAGAEELQYIQLVKIMEGITLFDSKDRWRWSLEGVASFKQSLRFGISLNANSWTSYPTRLNSLKDAWIVKDLLCPLCEKNVESSSHIFFTCPISREIFCKILLWWEIDVVMVFSDDEWLEWLLSILSYNGLKENAQDVAFVINGWALKIDLVSDSVTL
ncbi:RNA-directed DNA polymerase, eukaryota, reverse transcriptase zinc-binding domain protein [Tanacetum coccineum]